MIAAKRLYSCVSFRSDSASRIAYAINAGFVKGTLGAAGHITVRFRPLDLAHCGQTLEYFHTLQENSMKASSFKGIALATAVAGLFAVASISTASAADDAKVKCEKSSSCKGQSACKNTANSCKGKNSCKGQGMTMQTSDSACKDAQALARSLLDKQNG